jgi:hypothetical protein
MYASGSTWLFNTTREVASALGRPKVAGSYAESMAVLNRLPANALNVVKTHDLPRAEAAFMTGRATHIFVSIRDPRDAVVSLMQHMGHKFGQALAKVERSAAFCGHFADDARTELFSLDQGFTEDMATFDRLAAALGGGLAPATREDLFAGSRRSAIEAKIAGLDSLPTAARDLRSGDVVDTDTQWHRHHAGRTGELGRWRKLLPDNAARHVEQRMGDWMRRFGYLDG